jgi:hypothetical protein
MKEETSKVYRLDVGLPNYPIYSYNFLVKVPWRIFVEDPQQSVSM